MSNPELLVIAGCNGSGKSSFSKALVPGNIVPFDYDFYFLKFYQSLIPTDFQDEMAHNMAFQELEKQVQSAISNSSSFCYETNFDSNPLYWPTFFKEKGFEVNLIYFCLDSVMEAKRRVAIRVENGGHFVPEKEISRRFIQGYLNLDIHFKFFNNLHVFDCSRYNREPLYCFSLQNGNPVKTDVIPSYLKKIMPKLYSQVSEDQ
ncbi:zeta toxin family protein [Aquiflexum sp. LQ15W]|uniref:zeta toxin family protein n=1 Tax=Cognataquiflexum nitidum TaxID=2922272 RepID=UPI001F133579|nr:zeta toxin family protein [Cognataquiflexum nitidum]MCH6201991.1 zeta toxin family protein [Cognataquiflexum nitidum]